MSDKKVRAQILNKYGGRCAYCGCKLKKKFTIDHIIPKMRKMEYSPQYANRGKDEIENYNPCCSSCNSSKRSFSIEDWRENIKHKIIQLNRDSATYRTAKRFGLVKETGVEVIFYFERNA